MTVAEQLRNFFQENQNTPYCDDCTQRKLSVLRIDVQSATKSLRNEKGFKRAFGTCGICGQGKAVSFFIHSRV